MAKDVKDTKKTSRRTQVKELPKREQELSKAEQKKIKGGPGFGVGLEPAGLK